MMIGGLRHLITVQRLAVGSPQQTDTGEPDVSWNAFLTDIHASVEPLRGRELFAAQELHSEVEVRIRIRYRAGITTQMRVVFASRYYEILSVVDPEERHRELELMCKVGVSEG